MRLMEAIRKKGGLMLAIFLGFFLVSIFAGLGVGAFSFRSCDQLGLNQPTVQSSRTYLVNDSDWNGVVMRVNGRPVEEERYFQVLDRIMEAMRAGSDEDPAVVLEAYSYASEALIREETLMERGEELNITVSSADMKEAKDEMIARYMNTEDPSSGNIVGDLAKSLGSARDRKAAFNQFLQANGLSEEMWQDQARREVFLRKTREALQNTADEEKKISAEAKKATVDEALESGEDFSEVAREYSDDPSAAQGGDVGTWVQRGLLYDESIENKLFETPVGESTEWFDIPAGFQRFYVYDKLEPEGEEFEAMRDDLIAQIREEKGEDYEPSADEIAKRYEKVKFYQILLSTTDQGAAQREAQALFEAADVEINDPMVLARQAIDGTKVQPPHSVSADDLVTLARNTAATEDYDFSLIQDLLDNAQATDAEADAQDAGETVSEDIEVTATPVEVTEGDAAATDEAVDEAAAEETAATDDAAAESEELPDLGFPEQEIVEEPDPVYALAIGLFKLGLQTDEDQGATIQNYLIGKTYLDWLDNKDVTAAQPLDRQQAREQAEENLARATDTFNYNPTVYAMRGLNLAWLDRTEEAEEQLNKAQQYAPHQTGGVWDTIRKAWEVIGDEEKLQQVDDLIAAMRQEQLRQAIEQAQQGGEGGQPGQINFGNLDLQPPAGGDAADDGAADEGAADDGADAAGDEGAAEDGATSGDGEADAGGTDGESAGGEG